MVDTKTYSESDGEFTKTEYSKSPCAKCKAYTLKVETWNSSCGGYEDYKITCDTCKHAYFLFKYPDS